MSHAKETPANLDAEEGLLASCIIDPVEVVNRCIAEGIQADSFFSFPHQYIYSAIEALHRKKQAIDEITICEQLLADGTLEKVGGHAEVNRLTNRIETSAHFRFWLEIVREKSLARKVISSATAIIERVYASEPLEEVLNQAESKFTSYAKDFGGKRQTLLARLEASKFDLSNPPPVPLPIINFCGKTIFTEGNMSSFIAGKSSGKTSSVTAMISSIMGQVGRDYLGFEGFNAAKKDVLYFDSEQSEYDFDCMQKRILYRGGLKKEPDWFHAYHVKPFTTKDRRKAVFDRIRKSHETNGCLLAVIDGAVDLLTNFNDIVECDDLIAEIMALTHETKCHIHMTLHVNPGQKRNEHQDKARGHLGTFLEQRSETVLLSTKKRVDNVEEMVIDTKDARHGILAKPSRIRWCDQHKMLMTYKGPQVMEKPKEPGRPGQFNWHVIASYITADMPPVTDWTGQHMDIIAQRAGCSVKTVRRICAQKIAEDFDPLAANE